MNIFSFANKTKNEDNIRRLQWEEVFANIWGYVKVVYSDHYMLLWSAWYALSLCGWYSVVNYIQSLWASLDSEANLNGIVVTASNILGSL